MQSTHGVLPCWKFLPARIIIIIIIISARTHDKLRTIPPLLLYDKPAYCHIWVPRGHDVVNLLASLGAEPASLSLLLLKHGDVLSHNQRKHLCFSMTQQEEAKIIPRMMTLKNIWGWVGNWCRAYPTGDVGQQLPLLLVP